MQPTITASQILMWVPVITAGAAAGATVSPARGNAPGTERGVFPAGDRGSSLMRRDSSRVGWVKGALISGSSVAVGARV